MKLTEIDHVDLIVIDSLSALVPENELDDFEFREGTRRATIASLALPRLAASLARSGCGLIVTNQVRDKVGVLFGNPETSTGGRALRHYASIRLELRVSQNIKEGDITIGSRTKVRVVKNKVGPPFRQVESDLLYSHGFCPAGDMLDLGMQHGLISRNRCELQYRGEVIPGGRESARRFLISESNVRSRLCTDLRGELGLPKCQQECGACLAYCSAAASQFGGAMKLSNTSST